MDMSHMNEQLRDVRARQPAIDSFAMRVRTSRAIRSMLPSPDLGGYCAYPSPTPPLATAWIRDEFAGFRGRQIVFIDTPTVRRALHGRIVYGMPEVFESDGVTPVDQLALVRFYLSHRGTAEWPPRRLATHLVDAGYSTQAARRHHRSLSFAWRGQSLTEARLRSLPRGIDRHLDFYRDGTLFRRIGDNGPAVAAFTLLPPDGRPYLTPPDHFRIRASSPQREKRTERGDAS